MSYCQLACIDSFFDNIQYFTRNIKSTRAMEKIGVFDLQLILTMLYNTGKCTT